MDAHSSATDASQINVASSTTAFQPLTSDSYGLSDAGRDALAITKRGVDELLIESDFAKKLMRSEQTGKPLRIKLGLDPGADIGGLGIQVQIKLCFQKHTLLRC